MYEIYGCCLCLYEDLRVVFNAFSFLSNGVTLLPDFGENGKMTKKAVSLFAAQDGQLVARGALKYGMGGEHQYMM